MNRVKKIIFDHFIKTLSVYLGQEFNLVITCEDNTIIKHKGIFSKDILTQHLMLAGLDINMQLITYIATLNRETKTLHINRTITHN